MKWRDSDLDGSRRPTTDLPGGDLSNQRPLYPNQGGLFHARNQAGVSWQKGTYVHLPFPRGLT